MSEYQSTQFSADVIQEHGLTPKEWALAVEICGREPNLVELGIFSVMWSEHCSYKSSKVHLKRLPTEGPSVILGPGENAGVVDIGDGLAVCFKMESHNHPSFIEPHQGAATGVGGIMRDIFTMGARPIASLNSLRFGPVDHPRTKHLLTGVVSGIGSYGNCMGVPTVGGEVQFHEKYAGNILVNAFNLGIVPSDRIFLGQATGVGNPVIYVGSKTGRDGIHGATMASDSFDDEALEKRPTVQVGDPFTEKRLLEACLELFEQNLVLGIQDMGAAGLTCSTFEMAGRAGTGIILNLDDIPLRERGMTAYEILLSESQERMLLVCVPENVAAVKAIFDKWDLDCAVCGTVTDTGRVVVTHHGEQVVDLPASPLSDSAPMYERPYSPPVDLEERRTLTAEECTSSNPLADLHALLASPNLSSRRFIYRQYDHMVRLGTRVGPGGDAALIRIPGTDKAVGMTVDCNSRWCWLNPRDGAAMAVAEGVRNLACVGAEPLGSTDCLNFGNPERPEIMWEFAEAITGMAEACAALDAPITGGNVSLYNETDGTSILPTPTIAVVGLRTGMSDDVRNPSSAFTESDCEIAVIGDPAGGTLGGSEFVLHKTGRTAGNPPRCDLSAEKITSDTVRALVQGGSVTSAHDVSDGGLLVALAECTGAHYGTQIGAQVSWTGQESKATALFGEAGARVVVSYPISERALVHTVAEKYGAPITVIGTTGGDELSVNYNGERIDSPLSALFASWDNGLTEAVGLDG